MVQLAVFEPQIPVECPAYTPPLDFDDQNNKEEQIGSLNLLDWQLLRIAIALHCVPICGKIVRAVFLVSIWIWGKL